VFPLQVEGRPGAGLLEDGASFVKVLAGPYERGKTEQARERFLDMQTAIGPDFLLRASLST
jgi:hypothetical protein